MNANNNVISFLIGRF